MPLYSRRPSASTYGATNGKPFYSRRLSAQSMAQPMGGSFILGGRVRYLWRNPWEAVLFSVAECKTYGATHWRPFCSQRPSVQPKAQPMGGRFILGGQVRNPWSNLSSSSDNMRYRRIRWTTTATMTRPKATPSTPAGPRSPFGLVTGPKRRAVFQCINCAEIGNGGKSWG